MPRDLSLTAGCQCSIRNRTGDHTTLDAGIKLFKSLPETGRLGSLYSPGDAALLKRVLIAEENQTLSQHSRHFALRRAVVNNATSEFFQVPVD